MFSANENIVLRQHKRRIMAYVEDTMNDNVLDQGTSVMVMQVSCKAPGCVPLETILCVVFPKPALGSNNNTELLKGLPESATGGTYKTKVLKPMADVTKDDVLDALPPAFKGGRRSVASLCLQARDVMLAQVTQMMDDNDLEGKKLMVTYLMASLNEYLERGCVAPEYGKDFPPVKTVDDVAPEATKTAAVMQPTGNVVIRRIIDEHAPTRATVDTLSANNLKSTVTYSNPVVMTLAPKAVPTSMDWRRQQC